MEFSATGTNITELLVVSLAVVALMMLLRKRYDSNIPLLFYFLLVVFMNASERSLNPILLYGGLALALTLRFEFMGTGFSKFIAFLANGALCVIIYSMVMDVFSS